MNVTIASFLKSKLVDAVYVDRLSGLIREVRKKYPASDGSGRFNLKTFPASLDGLNENTCLQDSFLQHLVPDASKRSIIYFEDGGIIFQSKTGHYMNFVSTLTLVGWINMKKFLTDEGTISQAIVADILSRMDFTYGNSAGLSKIKVVKVSERPKSMSIFSKWSYDDTQGFLIYPYDFFALQIETEFSMSKECIKEIKIDESNCAAS